MQALLPVVPVELGVDVLRSEPRVRFVTIDLMVYHLRQKANL